VEFTLHFEEIPCVRKYFIKEYDQEKIPTEDDRQLLRNKPRQKIIKQMWDGFINYVFKRKKINHANILEWPSVSIQ